MKKFEISAPDLNKHTKRYLLDMEALIASEIAQLVIRTGKEPTLSQIMGLALNVAYQNGVIDGIHSEKVVKEHPAYDYLVKLRKSIIPIHETIEAAFRAKQESDRIAKNRLN